MVTMAEQFSVERRKLMRFLGAKVVLTPAAGRALAMVTKAVELAKMRGWFLTRQFENEANPDYHSRTTAREIVDDFKGEKLDYWVTGYGTGGTLKGVARVLAKEMPDTKIIVCEPEDAQLLTSGLEQARNPDGSASSPHPAFKPHPMQGWTPDFIPKLTADAVAAEGDRPDHHDPGRRRRCAARRNSPRRKGFSSASRPARPSRARCASPRRRRRARTSCACCPTPASAISRRRCSRTCRPT